MDRFLKTKPVSESPLGPGPAIVNVWGNPGSGKSFGVRAYFANYLELDSDTLRGKQSTISFMERAACTDLPVIIDDWNIVSELIGSRELVGPINKSITVIISPEPLGNEDFEFRSVQWEDRTLEQLKIIGKKYSDDSEKIHRLSVQCGGNLHVLISSLTFDSIGDRDIFESPKNYIYGLLCRGGDNEVADCIGESLCEHGYMWGVVQENYVDTPGETMDFYADIADHLSLAGGLDDKIYDGNWHLLPFFNLHAVMYPARMIDHRLEAETLRPGSMWTKYQNMCMRQKKLKNISQKNLDIDCLMLLRDYCQNGDVTMLRHYKFDCQDLDILNHLAIVTKIKPRIMTQLKKALKS
jgi:hypothetical protein